MFGVPSGVGLRIDGFARAEPCDELVRQDFERPLLALGHGASFPAPGRRARTFRSRSKARR